MKKTQIIELLQNIEQTENIEILYACEAGSRVWGFSRKDSDYDIRLIYKKVNVEDYLTLENTSDVIEYSGECLDIVGWDIKKALKLHMKNNPTLREMLISDIVYIDNGIHKIFDDLEPFNKDMLKNHYSSIALKHWKKYCGLEFSKTKTKKYLYVIRSILSWRLLDLDICPPLSIKDLVNHEKLDLEDSIKKAINELIDCHTNDNDICEKTILKLNNFILNSLDGMKKVKTNSNKNIE